MDAVRLMGEIVKDTAEATKDRGSLGCAKLVVLCNAPDDNPFMAGAFHGVSEADAVVYINQELEAYFSTSSSIIIIEDYYLQTFFHSLELS